MRLKSDGDSLSAINLKVTEGQGEIVNNNDGTTDLQANLGRLQR